MEHVDPTLSWFAQRVERGREQPFSEIVEITPDIAKRLLEVNDSNRRINPRTVERFTHDIRAKQWRLNGDAIIVSKDGRLNTGQHRMLAVIAAGTPITTWATFGVDRDSRYTLNLGVPTTTINLLSMQAVSHPSIASVVAKNLYAFRNSLTHTQQKSGVSKPDIVAEYNRQSAAIDAAVARFAHEDFTRRTKTTAAVAAAYVIIAARRPPADKREVFFTKLASGANLGPDSVILSLRAKLMGTGQYNLRRTEARIELILRHWNAFMHGAPAASIRMSDRFPVVAR